VSDAVYERYKEALRRGHVATQRGRFDAALVEYADAAELAPDRALPHISVGATLRRMGRDEDALAAYGVALERAPGDPAALAGRAETLVALKRPVEAADAFDRLAEVHEAAGGIADACDTMRQALELAESRTRRRTLERLVRALRDGAQDSASEAALERAVAVLGMAVKPEATEPEVPHQQPRVPDDPTAVLAEAEVSLEAGDDTKIRDLFVRAAIAQRAAGHTDAALDACYFALAVAPGDPELHVVMAELYVDQGWHGPAAEKLLLLGRLVELTGDNAGRDRLCRVVARSFADDPRLAAICI
jgi:thioredoxin-like negative regulator of GroEL